MPHAGGRPIEYNKTITAKALKYVINARDKMEKFEELVNEDKGYVKYRNKLQVNIPTIEGLALHLGIHKDTVYDWENSYPEFSDVIAQLRAKQARMLISNGLSGDYNPVIAKVLLTKHGYREGVEQSGPEGGPIKLDSDVSDMLKRVYGGEHNPNDGDPGKKPGRTA